MLNIPTLEKLRKLKLYGMTRAFEDQIPSSEIASLSFEERLGLLVDREFTERENRRLRSRLRQARLRQQACMEDIDYQAARGLDKSLMRSLAACQWVRDHLNILMTGPTGVGKSFIASALGHRACMEGFRVLSFRIPPLFQELGIARGDGRYGMLTKTIAKAQLLILDDWGLASLSDPEQRDLLEILEDRYENRSTIIVSQIPVDHWHEIIGNPTLADAILDRVVHNAYKITLKGGSMRKKKSPLT